MSKNRSITRVARRVAAERIKELQEKYGLPDAIEALLFLTHGLEPDPNSGQPGVLRPILSGVDREGNAIRGTPPEVRAYAAAELAKYLYPKRKAVSSSGGEGNPIKFIVAPDLSSLPFETCIHCGRQQTSQAQTSASDGEFRI